jgi:hypothetical protein
MTQPTTRRRALALPGPTEGSHRAFIPDRLTVALGAAA